MKFLLPLTFLLSAAMIKSPPKTEVPVVHEVCIYKKLNKFQEAWVVACKRVTPEPPQQEKHNKRIDKNLSKE